MLIWITAKASQRNIMKTLTIIHQETKQRIHLITVHPQDTIVTTTYLHATWRK
jgi:cellobiose-specific phosphotransferase system component IIA